MRIVLVGVCYGVGHPHNHCFRFCFLHGGNLSSYFVAGQQNLWDTLKLMLFSLKISLVYLSALL